MNNFDTYSKTLKAYKILRIITTVFAILDPLAMICSAVVMTLCDGDWWFNLFAFYLAAIVMIFGTLYLSLLALMSEMTRYFKNKAKSDFSVPPVVKWIHRLIMGASIAGLISYIPFHLIRIDVLNGGLKIYCLVHQYFIQYLLLV